MSTIAENELRLGDRIRSERMKRQWSLAELAERSGVSRAMLSKIERDEASPTAELLVRIASAFGMTLSSLIALAEMSTGGQVLRAEEQRRWTDPATGYIRRHVSPPSPEGLELIHVRLPPGEMVNFPADVYGLSTEVIWVLSGRLKFTDGDTTVDMLAGDCYRMGPVPAPRRYHAPGPEPAVYLVALVSRRG
jgi:transcriptional regulator with XRE-family HTH domain